ncbi:MAG: ferritin family protein [Candidatus Zixiibacteriota bacterium]
MFEDLNLTKSLKLAIKTEQMGNQFYVKMAAKFADNKDIAGIFAQLAKDEKVHEAQFTKILDSVPDEVGGSNYETDQYVKAIAITEFFRVGKAPKPEDIGDEADALGAALAFEKSTLLFYQSIKDIIGDGVEINKIIAAEKSHIISLSRIIVTDAKFRGIHDNF